MEILHLEHISKRFGSVNAINDLTLSVTEHSVLGFIGKNGAGKTTTMKMILGFLKPDSGSIHVCGERVLFGNTKTNRHIGYLPDVPSFYGYMTPVEYLAMCGNIAGMDTKRVKARTEELLELTGLHGDERRIKGFSRGMQQRLGIAQAMLHEPKLLICDEPTSALDPVGRKEILDILLLARSHTTIVFSTHILSDVERICDHIGVIDHGRLVLHGTLAALKKTYRQDTLLLEFKAGTMLEPVAGAILSLESVYDVSVSDNSITVALNDAELTGSKILEMIVSQQLPLLRYEIGEPTLERVFLEAVR